MDFEASGFGPSSYPIEVGFVLETGERYCRLIRPLEKWTYWDDKAESLHNISRQTLSEVGSDAKTVCIELNARLKGMTIYSDAWVADSRWLATLFESTGVKLAFKLSAIENILSECQYLVWDKTRDKLLKQLGGAGARHRASSDAVFIQSVYAETQNVCLRNQPSADN